VLADSQILTDQTPLSIACSETLLAGYLARFMHAYLERDPHIALSTHHTPVILARVRGGMPCSGSAPVACRRAMGCAERLLEALIWWGRLWMRRRSRITRAPCKKL
jgi:hypothetical protein